MPDITYLASLAPAIAKAALSLKDITPPLDAAAKYVMSKASPKMIAEGTEYQQAILGLMKKHAPKDDKGEPIWTVGTNAAGEQTVEVKPVDVAAYQAEKDTLDKEVVTIAGSRMITHAEIGKCPIPQWAYDVLLGVVIVDEPPA